MMNEDYDIHIDPTKKGKSEPEEEDDYYSEENIQERKELRRDLYPKSKKPYYPPYEPYIKKGNRKRKQDKEPKEIRIS